MLRDYQSTILGKFYKINDVTDQKILEVGGHKIMSVPYDLISHGAKEVVSISIDRAFSRMVVSDNITTKYMNAGSTDFLDNSFDSIISIATIEHILDLPSVLKELHRVVKPGGIVYMQGGPLWSGSCGAHYNFWIGDVEYHFVRNRILHDWEHLYAGPEGIIKRLTTLYPIEAIDKLLDMTYNADFINRSLHTDIIQNINDSDFLVQSMGLHNWHPNIPDDLLPNIRKRIPHFVDVCDEICVCLRKQLS